MEKRHSRPLTDLAHHRIFLTMYIHDIVLMSVNLHAAALVRRNPVRAQIFSCMLYVYTYDVIPKAVLKCTVILLTFCFTQVSYKDVPELKYLLILAEI